MRSKKEIADDAIQGTNDSSIASKRSVESLYGKKDDVEFFKYFVQKPQRRSPVVNRGYWTRMKAMGFNIEKFAMNELNGKKVVVNLGCGFDPYAFDYLNKKDDDLIFVDVDYPELMKKKADVIVNTPELVKILKNVQQNTNHIHLQSSNYYAISCDLRDLNRFSNILNDLFTNDETSFLFVAEVSITYMTQQCADDLIEWAATLKNAEFALLEQMMPAGISHPFAKRMINHFKSYNSPLNCIEAYPTLKHQIQRFEHRRWGVRMAKDLYRFWKEDISQEDKQFVESVEQFDEFEEFILFGQHYFILHAVNTLETHRKLKGKRSRLVEQPKVEITTRETDLKVKLGAGALLNDNPVSLGGMYMARSNELFDINGVTVSKPEPEKIKPRVCHTLTTLKDGRLFLAGGREGPTKILDDCWIFNNNEWTQVENLPQPRYRHCTVALPDNRVLIYGGCQSSSSPFLIWQENNGWQEYTADLEPRFSAALSWINSRDIGVLVGGMDSTKTVKRDSYHLVIHDDEKSVHCIQIAEDCLLERYSSQITILDDEKDTVLIAGGVSECELFNKHTTLIMLEDNGSITPTTITGSELQPLWCSFSMQGFITFGGGAACYGFGSHWDCIHELDFK